MLASSQCTACSSLEPFRQIGSNICDVFSDPSACHDVQMVLLDSFIGLSTFAV